MSGLSSYDRIVARRATNRNFADLHEQRSSSRQAAAQRVISQGDSTRNAVANATADTNSGQSQLIANLIRTRMAADAKAKAQARAKYA